MVQSAKVAQAWLQEVAKVAASKGLPVHWTTPIGLPVLQSYYKTLGRKMDVLMAGERISLYLSRDATEIDKAKQSAGISPNLIHSLDASHLQATVGQLHDMGMRAFAMIHDSYGTHAGNVEVLGEVLREAFVEQYRDDVLARFRDEIAGQLSEGEAGELPAAPARGTLDLTVVLGSPYFFS